MMSYMNDLSRMIFMKVRSLTIVLSGLDDFNSLNQIYLRQFLGLIKNSRTRPRPWMLKMIERLHVGLAVSRISTLVLKAEDDQMASGGLIEVFTISTSILNIEDDEPSSIRWSSDLSCCFF